MKRDNRVAVPRPFLPAVVSVAELSPANEQASPIEMPVALREVLGFDFRQLCALPLPSTLLCVTHEGERLALRTSGSAPALDDALALVGPELSALALATEHDRGNRVAMSGWCARKRTELKWRLTSLEAVGSLGFSAKPMGWSTERVLRALGLQLLEVLV